MKGACISSNVLRIKKLPKAIWAKRSEAFYPLLAEPEGHERSERYDAGAHYYLSSLNLDVPINNIPMIPINVAIPELLSPKIFP